MTNFDNPLARGAAAMLCDDWYTLREVADGIGCSYEHVRRIVRLMAVRGYGVTRVPDQDAPNPSRAPKLYRATPPRDGALMDGRE